MDERSTKGNHANQIDILSTLFYIVNLEMTKPKESINMKVINKCVDLAPQIDSRFIVSEERKQAIKAAALDKYSKLHRDESFETTKEKSKKRISNKIKIAIIAAIISILIAGIAVYAFTDIFSLFFNDPREKLEWKDGESRRIDNYEMIISSELQQFDTIEDLKSVIDIPIICPEDNSERQINKILFSHLESAPAVIIDYTYNNVQINYTILINSTNPTQEEINTCDFERIETESNSTFFIMENKIGYQAIARIDDNVYIISSSNKDDIIQFIKNVKEL